MPDCTAYATWFGTVMDGEGSVALGSGVWDANYATPETADATNPEELLAAGHASCFAMTLSYVLEQAGYDPENVDAAATVTLDANEDGFDIPAITIDVSAEIPEASAEEFSAIADRAEEACPVSKALTGTDIRVNSSLA